MLKKNFSRKRKLQEKGFEGKGVKPFMKKRITGVCLS